MWMEFAQFLVKPPLYSPGTNQFWNDPHISRFVLASHLNPDEEAASRNPAFLDQSAAWIATIVPPSQNQRLLDLGCGPGLYAERFCKAGYSVMGIDFSERSIAYAKERAAISKYDISYLYQNYLSIEYENCFDLVTLIYCDYGVLPTDDRAALLRKVYRALRPGGKCILDVYTIMQHQGRQEAKDWTYYPAGGFWDKKPHLCLHAYYRYMEDQTVLDQTVIINEDGAECYNIWEHCFTKDSLLTEARAAGFQDNVCFGDITGKPLDVQGNMICAVLTKP